MVALSNDGELRRLRAVLRDLVALSAIPAVLIGKQPPAVAGGLADALVDLLQLDFAFVRLRDPDGTGAVDVTRGRPWAGFSDWLETDLASRARLTQAETIDELRDGSQAGHGVAIPIGVDGEAGVVLAASGRSDFPTAMEQLLLSLATNHAATAFQSARLIYERTAELERTEAYLTEAQRLTHTGSFGLDPCTLELTHSSDEHTRLYGFDAEDGTPTLRALLGRIHPRDRARCVIALKRGIRDVTKTEVEYRVVLPQGTVKRCHAVAHPVFDEAGELDEFVGTIVDVTESRQAEAERRAQLWFFESMDRINRAMQGTSDAGEMLGAVLDVALAIFDCDRAWLVYPCDPDVEAHRVLMERTRPVYPGAFAMRAEIPNEPVIARDVRLLLDANGPVRFDPESGHPLPPGMAEHFGVKSMIAMAVYPKLDKPYMFGLHQCSHARVWTPAEERLFQETGRRLGDALNTLLVLRDLRESERQLERSRTELAASRARIVAAADESRRRLERDLHDGIQQQLVAVRLQLAAIEDEMPPDDERKSKLSQAADDLAAALHDLVEISRGIHPAALAEAGIGLALKTLVRRSPVPVVLDVRTDVRLPGPVEVAAYYVVSEALTNTAKHAEASAVHVAVEVRDGALELSIEDDGRGGADANRGTGLIGLADRVDALGGSIEVSSAVGRGTRLHVTLPIGDVEQPAPAHPRYRLAGGTDSG